MRQHKICSETLNRSLMAAQRCARARCAGANTVGVDRQLRQSESLRSSPTHCGSPERFPVASSPARQGSVHDGSTLTEPNRQESTGQSLRFFATPPPLAACLSSTCGRSVKQSPECGRLLCAECRRGPLDRVCRVRSTSSTSTGTSPRSKTARSVSPREGSRVSNRNCSWGQVGCSNSKATTTATATESQTKPKRQAFCSHDSARRPARPTAWFAGA